MVAPEFIAFHTDRPQGRQGAHPNANLDSGGYMRMLDMLFRSARLFHPAATCVLVTDEQTRVRGVRPPFETRVHEVDHAAISLSRALAQCAHLASTDFAHPKVLIDSDILVNRSLAGLFGEDFDVGLTWRKSTKMPINGGLIFVNNRRPERGIEFFRRFVEYYRARSPEQKQWIGD